MPDAEVLMKRPELDLMERMTELMATKESLFAKAPPELKLESDGITVEERTPEVRHEGVRERRAEFTTRACIMVAR